MAVTDFGVTSGDVIAHLPIDASNISATTVPLSTTDIDAYIDDASAKMAGVLQGAGLSAASLDDDATAQIASAVKWYAVAECYGALGHSKKASDDARQRWVEVYTTYKANPRAISGKSSRVRSNVDTTRSRKKRFIGTTYKF